MEDRKPQGSDRMRRQARTTATKGRRPTRHNDSEQTGLLLGSSGVTPIKMTRNRALALLGLVEFPLHGEIHTVAKKLLDKHAPEQGGNPRKYQMITCAQQMLVKEQDRIIGQFGRDMEQVHRDYQTSMQPFYQKYGQGRKYYNAQEIIDFISKLGTQMQALNLEYMKELKNPNLSAEDCRKAVNEYYQKYRKIVESVHDSRVEAEDLSAIQDAVKKLYVDPKACGAHLPYGYKLETEIAIDPIMAFEEQFNAYLYDINALKADYSHHQQAFTDLHDAVQRRGGEYLAAIRLDGADVEQLSQNYATEFKAAVDTAKKEFATEPGIWQNLGPILKAIFTVLFFVKYFISLAETEVDKNRMYQGEPHSIQEKWDRWEMDVMPALDIEAHTAKQNAAK